MDESGDVCVGTDRPNPSLVYRMRIQVVRWQYDMNDAAVALARQQLGFALEVLGDRWKTDLYLVGELVLLGMRDEG